jgi:hypothetical protein
MMKHISEFLPTALEIMQDRERALLREEVRHRKFLTDMVAIRFADSTYEIQHYV